MDISSHDPCTVVNVIKDTVPLPNRMSVFFSVAYIPQAKECPFSLTNSERADFIDVGEYRLKSTH
jgi:hypothetical protein